MEDDYSDNATRCEAASIDAHELLRRYAEGQRSFRSLDFRGLNLTKADSTGIDFAGAMLNNANLIGTDLINANLNWTMLKGANLSGAYLAGAKMLDDRMHNGFLETFNNLGI